MVATLAIPPKPDIAWACLRSAARAAAIGALLCGAPVTPAHSQMLGLRATAHSRSPKHVVANAMEEASRRFNIPLPRLRAVMDAESHGDAAAVSGKGAIGLMQIMPATYEELRAKHGLGPDPFDPRDNILAGAAYLSEMFSRYGERGFLPAYNAGPGRYEKHLATGRALPSETVHYVTRIAPRLGLPATVEPSEQLRFDASRSPIFFTKTLSISAPERPADGGRTTSDAANASVFDHLFPGQFNNKLFAARLPADDSSKAPPKVAHAHSADLFVARATSESTP